MYICTHIHIDVHITINMYIYLHPHPQCRVVIVVYTQAGRSGALIVTVRMNLCSGTSCRVTAPRSSISQLWQSSRVGSVFHIYIYAPWYFEYDFGIDYALYDKYDRQPSTRNTIANYFDIRPNVGTWLRNPGPTTPK